MKKFILWLSVMFIFIFSSTSFAKNNQQNLDMVKSYLVTFHSSVDTDLIKSNGGKIKKNYKNIPVVAVDMSVNTKQKLASNPKVAYIEEDSKIEVHGQVIPWGITHIRAIDVQQTGITGSGIKVGILDTGIDYSHEDLNVSGGTTFVSGTTDYMDDNGHGTHLAGIVASLNNSVGVIGVAPQVNLYAVKVLDRYGNGNYSNLIAGIDWAISNNLNIINMSLGGNNSSNALKAAVDRAFNAGILLIASAGNNGFNKKGNICYPAAYDSVIAVGAVDGQNNRASFSSVGRQLDLVAPGVDILSTIPGDYGYNSGTSMATAHVTGVAALVWEVNNNLGNINLRNILFNSSTKLGDPFLYGYGLVNTMNALNYISK